MRPIIPERPRSAPSLPASSPEECLAKDRGRMARLAALDPEQPHMALVFLTGYHPAVFDTILDAARSPQGSRAPPCRAGSGAEQCHGPAVRGPRVGDLHARHAPQRLRTAVEDDQVPGTRAGSR